MHSSALMARPTENGKFYYDHLCLLKIFPAEDKMLIVGDIGARIVRDSLAEMVFLRKIALEVVMNTNACSWSIAQGSNLSSQTPCCRKKTAWNQTGYIPGTNIVIWSTTSCCFWRTSRMSYGEYVQRRTSHWQPPRCELSPKLKPKHIRKFMLSNLQSSNVKNDFLPGLQFNPEDYIA